MSHFLTVTAFDLANLMCCFVQTILVLINIFFFALIKLGCIDSYGGGVAFVTTLFLAILLVLHLFRHLVGLGLLLLLLRACFLGPSLRFVNSRVFYGVALSASLSDVRLVAIQIFLVHIFNI